MPYCRNKKVLQFLEMIRYTLLLGRHRILLPEIVLLPTFEIFILEEVELEDLVVHFYEELSNRGAPEAPVDLILPVKPDGPGRAGLPGGFTGSLVLLILLIPRRLN